MTPLELRTSGIYPRLTSQGSDPEFFIRDKKTHKVIPAFTFLPPEEGRKDKTCAPFYDGFQAEFTPKSTHCLRYWGDNVQANMLALHSAAEKVGGYISFEDSVDLPDIRKHPPQFTQLGCSPSLNVWDKKSVLTPRSAAARWRSAGCHIHLGYSKESYYVTIENNKQAKFIPVADPIELVKSLDQITGPVFTLLARGLETPRRRKMYGRAGEYRVKPYGIEYRTPPPAIMVHPVVMQLAFTFARAAAALKYYSTSPQVTLIQYSPTVFSPPKNESIQKLMDLCNHTPEQAATMLNNADIKTAEAMFDGSRKFYELLLHLMFPSLPTKIPAIIKLIEEGATKRWAPEQYVEHWKLKSERWAGYSSGPNEAVDRWIV